MRAGVANTSVMNHPRTRIAIVGAGVSGLVAAHRLADDHDVTVFEAASRPGGHACTLDVDGQAVDVGFLVLNDRNYPRFEALLAELGVATQPSDMSFSVSDGRGFEYAGSGPRAVFARRRHLADPRFLRMLGEYARFNRDARALLACDEDPSLRAWLEARGYSRWFVERLLVPQAAAVWSADPQQMWTFPARFLVAFFANHGMLGFRDRPRWRTISGGSRSYVECIAARLGERLRLATPVRRITRDGAGVTVDGERFDELVLACHADHALALLADATPLERELLGAIPYGASELCLHSDASLMPRRRAAWASWNYHLLDDAPAAPTVTYWINRLQSLPTRTPLLVSLNLTRRIDPAKVHAVLPVAHPTYTPAGVAAQARWHEVSGVRRTHFCGAYWGWGFHEDGVVSGERVAAAILARTPAAVAA